MADSPIKGYKNIMYSLHFYANEWSHNEYLPAKLDYARKKGLPVMVTEFGMSDASGNGQIMYDKYREMAEKAGSDKYELFLLEFDKQKRVQCLIGSGKQ